MCREGHLKRRGDHCKVERNIAEKSGLQKCRKGGTLQRRVEREDHCGVKRKTAENNVTIYCGEGTPQSCEQ